MGGVAAEDWHCPRCRGAVPGGPGARLQCKECRTEYPIVAGIPDLRIPGQCAIDFAADTVAARGLAETEAGGSLEELVRRALSSRSPSEWTVARLDLRTRQSLEAPARLRAELQDWLRPCVEGPGPLLDAGCGFGGLLLAAAEEGIDSIGIDASLVNLVVARRALAERGRRPLLAAALVEHLPLADEGVSAAVALDVVEHVADPGALLSELARVTRPGGWLALSTPNRFSLAAEPHVDVWGVGWLPRRWQAPYVRWRTGITYSHVRLLGARELERLLRRHGGLAGTVGVAPVPSQEMAAFAPRRRRLARLYNRLLQRPAIRAALRLVGPFFHVIARKPMEDRAAIRA